MTAFRQYRLWLYLVLARACMAWQVQQDRSRRKILEAGFLIGGILITDPYPAIGARGAAELDLEFYIRDLIGGNKKDGNIDASVPPAVAPPRTLDGKLIPMLLDEQCSLNCIPCQALVQQIQQRTGKDAYVISADIERRVQNLRERSSRSFQKRAPWKEENTSDQYYFDFTSYAFWRTAADLLPDYVDRDKFVRKTGRLLYDKLLSDGLIKPIKSSGTSISLSSVIPATTDLLEVFQTSGFCKGFTIRGDDSKDADDPVFDELDDESIKAGNTVDCLVSVFEPATLGASLQITGEQSRFGPDFVGCTLAALWETAGVQSSWETFFVDPEYRSNPKDYFPNEQLIQYTLSKK